MSTVQWIVSHEAEIRLGVFVFLLAALRGLEWRYGLRSGNGASSTRQLANAGLLVLDTAVLRFAFPLLAVALAVALEGSGVGVFAVTPWPAWLEVPLAVLLLDLGVYWQHRLMHRVPILWRMHRVHHTDLAFDVTTGVRFHPFEIAFSMGWKLALVVLLGAAPLAVVLFEVLLSATSLFTHANFAFPRSLDAALRRVIVTPSMHRIHHSVLPQETNSNFGFSLSCWDRIFASYRASPMQPEVSMPIGLEQFRTRGDQHLISLLAQPFRTGATDA
jgi:sterol desaturase/sphingolipid hydroxylase (fatty acid hydroxylase superfamily)